MNPKDEGRAFDPRMLEEIKSGRFAPTYTSVDVEGLGTVIVHRDPVTGPRAWHLRGPRPSLKAPYVYGAPIDMSLVAIPESESRQFLIIGDGGAPVMLLRSGHRMVNAAGNVEIVPDDGHQWETLA